MRLNPSVTEVARNFTEYINRVASGRSFVLMRGQKAVAELRPISLGKRLDELSDLLASVPRLGRDEAAELAADLDRFAKELQERPAPDPCAS